MAEDGYVARREEDGAVDVLMGPTRPARAREVTLEERERAWEWAWACADQQAEREESDGIPRRAIIALFACLME